MASMSGVQLHLGAATLGLPRPGLAPAGLGREARPRANARHRHQVVAKHSTRQTISISEELRMVEEYNRTMSERMGWAKTRQGLNPYEYHPERGAQARKIEVFEWFLMGDYSLGRGGRC